MISTNTLLHAEMLSKSILQNELKFRQGIDFINHYSKYNFIEMPNCERDKLLYRLQGTISGFLPYFPLTGIELNRSQIIYRSRKEEFEIPFKEISKLSYNKEKPKSISSGRYNINMGRSFYEIHDSKSIAS